MFVNFSEETQHILKQAQKEMYELNHPYIGSEHLFLAILKEKNNVSEILKKYKVTYELFKKQLINIVGVGSIESKFILYTPLLKKILQNVSIEARENNNKMIEPDTLIISILEEEDGIAFSILNTMNINIEKLYRDIRNLKRVKPKKKKLLLEELGVDLIKLAKEKKLDPVVGREKETKEVIEILLRRKKNNPILIGPAGVGKTAIVEGLALLIKDNSVPKNLLGKRIIALNIFSLVAGTKYRGEFEDKMKTIIKELEDNDDIILFIDEIHTIVGAGGAEGAIDASNIFKPSLARGIVKIIGATTIDEYKKYIEPDAALSRRFQKIIIEEPTYESVVNILKKIKPIYENYHNVIISNDIINSIAKLSKKYILNKFEPDRSIDILDEVCTFSSIKNDKDEKYKKNIENKINIIINNKKKAVESNDYNTALILKKEEVNLCNKLNILSYKKKKVELTDVLNTIAKKSNIPIINDTQKRELYYTKLKKELNKIILGQENNIDSLLTSLKRKEFLNNKCYSILIAGSPGSGKTLLAETFIKKLFKENNIINVDMSEYNDAHTVSKLIGTTAGYLGYDNKNNIFERVRTNPYSALILDNVNMCCNEVANLFTRILEKSSIEDASGKLIDFSNTTIIMLMNKETSNVGFNSITNEDDELSSKFVSKIDTIINLNKLNNDKINIIVNNKIKEVFNKYKTNIKIDRNIILDKVAKDNNLSKLDQLIYDYVEKPIINTMLNKNNNKTGNVLI